MKEFMAEHYPNPRSNVNRRRFLTLAGCGAVMAAMGQRLAAYSEAQPIQIPADSGASSSFAAGPIAVEHFAAERSRAANIAAPTKDLYQIYKLSEKETRQTYIQLLHDACFYADRAWGNSSFDSAAGYWGGGFSGEYSGIRTIGSMVLACGTLLKYDNGLTASERDNLLAKTTAAIRYATSTHFTGSQKCTDGRQWGGMDRPGAKAGGVQWESTYWTGSLVFGAWLIWDKLEPSLRQDVERVVAAQVDFLTTGNPPTNLWSDTKAEENGWNVPCLALAELMFSSNPHAPLWHKTALKYMMNTLCTEADTRDTSLVDGHSVKDWVLGANLQPDYTLENHGRFHPSYVACSSYFLTQAAMYYVHANRPIPQSASHHLMDVWRMFQTIILPWGESADPQGMDWELHGLPYINLYAALATWKQDPFAAHMEQMSLQYQRAWQTMCHGSLTLPGSPAGISRHAINCEQASYGFLAHEIFGSSVKPLTGREANAQEEGVWDYPYVEFIEHRTLQKYASFSWKNHVMGLLMPIDNHAGNPEFIVPIADGLIGTFEIAGAKSAKATVLDHSRKQTADGFETSGTVLLNEGVLKQTLRMISIGKQTVVYEDRVSAMADVTVHGERGLPIGIENDSLTGGTRLVSNENGQTTFDWQKPQLPAPLPGSWANVDGRLGIVMLDGAGMAYAQASKYSPGIAVYTDIFFGSYSDHPRQIKSGDEVARRVGVFFVEVTPKQTALLSKSCRIDKTPSGQVLRFRQPDGKLAEVPLL